VFNDIWRAEGDDISTSGTRTRTHVDEEIGRTHELVLMLDNNDRTAIIAHIHEGIQQAPHFARMHSPRRLIEKDCE